MTRRPRVAVVGGGITGLAAAWFLREAADVTVVEAAPRLGGKIRTEPFAGLALDAGPDAFLARAPEAVGLARALGLGDELVSPAASSAYLWSRGRLRALPAGLVLGVPAGVGPLLRSRLLSPAGAARAGLDLVLPARRPAGDRSVGDLVTARFGREAHERLVDPLLGGIHAGRSEELSLAATAPQLDAAARSSRSLILGLRASRRRQAHHQAGPVFYGLPGGLGRLVEVLAARLAEDGVVLSAGRPVGAIEPAGRGGGYRVTLGTAPGAGRPGGGSSGGEAEVVEADAVVVATPAPAAAALLSGPCPAAAAELAGIAHAAVAVVALAYDEAALPGGRPPAGSGFLVPRPEGRLLTACTFSSSKWAHLARPGQVTLRASVGRRGDERGLALPDDELVARLHAELAEAIGAASSPAAARVSRWPASFPQYAVGHLDKVARVEAALAEATPGLVLAGSSLRGVGIPACIASARRAADSLAPVLAAGPPAAVGA